MSQPNLRPPMEQIEIDLAAAVSATLWREERRDLGTWKRRDGQDDSGLRVDFTFDNARPSVALEITSIQDVSFLRAGDACMKLAQHLTKTARREGLRQYVFAVEEKPELRKLADPLLTLMRSGGSVGSNLTANDHAVGGGAATKTQQELRHWLQALGVIMAHPADPGDETMISVVGESEPFRPIAGLEREIASNLPKLLEAGQKFERHLAIGVGCFGISKSPGATPLPTMPIHLDRLWLVHLWTPMNGAMAVWSVMPGDRTWRVHEPFLSVDRLVVP